MRLCVNNESSTLNVLQIINEDQSAEKVTKGMIRRTSTVLWKVIH